MNNNNNNKLRNNNENNDSRLFHYLNTKGRYTPATSLQKRKIPTPEPFSSYVDYMICNGL